MQAIPAIQDPLEQAAAAPTVVAADLLIIEDRRARPETAAAEEVVLVGPAMAASLEGRVVKIRFVEPAAAAGEVLEVMVEMVEWELKPATAAKAPTPAQSTAPVAAVVVEPAAVAVPEIQEIQETQEQEIPVAADQHLHNQHLLM